MFSEKDQVVTIFGYEPYSFALTSQLFHDAPKAEQYVNNGCDCIPIKLYLQK